MTKKLVPVLALAVSASTSLANLSSPGFVPTSLTGGMQLSQVAEAAEAIRREPQKDYHTRGEMVRVVANFRPNVKVIFYERYKDEHTRQIVEKVLSEVTSNAEGAASIDYKVPLEGNKDDVHIIAKGPNRTREIRIPIGASKPPVVIPPKPSVTYPLKISSPTDKVGHKDYMQSDVSLSINPANGAGILYAVTKTWTTDKLTGFTGGVEVALIDAKENILYVSELRRWGVNGRFIPGSSSAKKSTWNESVPADVMKNARKIAIVHRHTPKNRLMKMFANIKEVVEFIKPFIKFLAPASGGSSGG
ncbi:MAG: hypothetical protein KME64_01395 [Scytonematopsis contorta HA4267-MV1]|jgi:hypothetical protein|nr:hypothetical protein [Scytonematopsis contorta HA4267-MV1]